jgi:hypothetical protein
MRTRKKPDLAKGPSNAVTAREAALAEADEFVERARMRRKGACVSDSAEDLATIREERLEALSCVPSKPKPHPKATQ